MGGAQPRDKTAEGQRGHGETTTTSRSIGYVQHRSSRFRDVYVLWVILFTAYITLLLHRLLLYSPVCVTDRKPWSSHGSKIGFDSDSDFHDSLHVVKKPLTTTPHLKVKSCSGKRAARAEVSPVSPTTLMVLSTRPHHIPWTVAVVD